MAGQGQIILRGEDSKTCLSFPFRFVAGDLRGHRISGHLSDPIHLVLQSRRVAKKLANGYSVVSDEVRVSGTPHPKADILVRAGMDENFGFVLNPGRNITADIFGIRPTKIPCTAF